MKLLNWKTASALVLSASFAIASLGSPPLWSASTVQDAGQTAAERRKAQIERLAKAEREAVRVRRAEHVATLRAMQGAWQLVSYRSPDTNGQGRQEAAYMLVAGEFLTIEIHMAYFNEQELELASFIQTGTYRLNFTEIGELMASCLIGSVDDGSGLTAPQVPGTVSTYSIDQTKSTIFMTSRDTTRFEFERVATGALTELLYEETGWLPGATGREELQALQGAREAAAKK